MKSVFQLKSVAVLLTDFVWNLALPNTETRELLSKQPTNQPIKPNATKPNVTKTKLTSTNLAKPNQTKPNLT